ncbi:hypothetical protein BDD12DRAFT_898160 [Trichophaea hybrida]|nr:hypothetical protein BDD12DRAFT_898160 [Trichophaea hybrida]
MPRLWTLQETSLASEQEPWKPNFQFLGGPLAHAELDSSLQAIYDAETVHPVRTVEEIVLVKDSKEIRASVISNVVTYRSTSKCRNEPMCMAGLIDLDVAAILRPKTTKERMILFYTMLREVPTNIIFIQGIAKLKIAPFRWDPLPL